MNLLTKRPVVSHVTMEDRMDPFLALPARARWKLVLLYDGVEQRSFWACHHAAFAAAERALAVNAMAAASWR